MELREYESRVFDKLIDWLYGAPLRCMALSQSEWDHPKVDHDHALFWCKLAVMMEKLGVAEVATEAMKAIGDCISASYRCGSVYATSADTVNYVYKNTQPGSPSRSSVVKLVAESYFAEKDDKKPLTTLVLARNTEAIADVLAGVRSYMEESCRENACPCI
jgi:hypothetical protein